jgi:hypothetical protein
MTVASDMPRESGRDIVQRYKDSGDKVRETRQKTLDKQASSKLVAPMPTRFEMPVVGVSFTPAYPDNLLALEEALMEAEIKGERLACVIIRNPDNEHDPNACEVHVPALGAHGFVGFITRPIAARLAATIDAGVEWDGHVSHLKIHHDHLDRPGLDITLEQKT